MTYETFKLIVVLVIVVVIASSIGPLAKFLFARVGWSKYVEGIGDGFFALGRWSGQNVVKHRWIALAVACVGGSILLARHGI